MTAVRRARAAVVLASLAALSVLPHAPAAGTGAFPDDVRIDNGAIAIRGTLTILDSASGEEIGFGSPSFLGGGMVDHSFVYDSVVLDARTLAESAMRLDERMAYVWQVRLHETAAAATVKVWAKNMHDAPLADGDWLLVSMAESMGMAVVEHDAESRVSEASTGFEQARRIGAASCGPYAGHALGEWQSTTDQVNADAPQNATLFVYDTVYESAMLAARAAPEEIAPGEVRVATFVLRTGIGAGSTLDARAHCEAAPATPPLEFPLALPDYRITSLSYEKATTEIAPGVRIDDVRGAWKVRATFLNDGWRAECRGLFASAYQRAVIAGSGTGVRAAPCLDAGESATVEHEFVPFGFSGMVPWRPGAVTFAALVEWDGVEHEATPADNYACAIDDIVVGVGAALRPLDPGDCPSD